MVKPYEVIMEAMRRALAFYSDENNYNGWFDVGTQTMQQPKITKDRGKIATSALSEFDTWLTEKIRGATDLQSPQPVPHLDMVNPAIWDLVIGDMRQRDFVGAERYQVRLRPHNGRDALVDAYQEVLDLAAYLRQELYERNGE